MRDEISVCYDIKRTEIGVSEVHKKGNKGKIRVRVKQILSLKNTARLRQGD